MRTALCNHLLICSHCLTDSLACKEVRLLGVEFGRVSIYLTASFPVLGLPLFPQQRQFLSGVLATGFGRVLCRQPCRREKLFLCAAFRLVSRRGLDLPNFVGRRPSAPVCASPYAFIVSHPWPCFPDRLVELGRSRIRNGICEARMRGLSLELKMEE
jgi:hypothetical protein